MTEQIQDPVCKCGDPMSCHIDGEEQCVVVDCGCKEFEGAEDKN